MGRRAGGAAIVDRASGIDVRARTFRFSVSEDDAEVNVADLLLELARLPTDWHGAGTLSMPVLRALARRSQGVRRSMETGAGRSTLLLSHTSGDHSVFAIDGGLSLTQVRSSPLLNRECVTFIEGPTQQTLRQHTFTEPLDLALIDGPHGYPFPELEYYFVYPHLAEGGTLALDDIHIPTIHHLYRFLREDPMFRLEETVDTTAFFRRTATPTFDPFGDGWLGQPFNARRFPVGPIGVRARVLARRVLPAPVRRAFKKVMRRE